MGDPRTDRRSGLIAGLGFVVGAFALFALAVPSVNAEDPCVPDAPRHEAEVRGHTWTGTVVSADPVGQPKLDVQPWIISFTVDRVYADRPEPDVPTPAIDPTQPFALPSNTCGRPGDMGLRPGRRYLVSTSSFGDGTSIGSIIAWEIDGDRLTLVPGMYKTTTIGPQFMAVGTLDQALALVVPGAVAPSPGAGSPTPQVVASAAPGSTGTPEDEPFPTSLVATGVVVAVAGLALGGVMVALARRRGGRSRGGDRA